jgi:hypothetical protein
MEQECLSLTRANPEPHESPRLSTGRVRLPPERFMRRTPPRRSRNTSTAEVAGGYYAVSWARLRVRKRFSLQNRKRGAMTSHEKAVHANPSSPWPARGEGEKRG